MFKIRLNLLTQMTLLIIFVVFISTLLVSLLFSTLLEDIVENHMGKQAMTVAKLAAQNPTIIQGFNEDQPSEVIQPASEMIRQTTGADYVTIANHKDFATLILIQNILGSLRLRVMMQFSMNTNQLFIKEMGYRGQRLKLKRLSGMIKGKLSVFHL